MITNHSIVKVCGMRDAENIREVEKLSTLLSPLPKEDSSLFPLHSSLLFWLGFIFWPRSSRYVSERPAYLPQKTKRVGVFVDEEIEQVRHIAEEFALDIIQLHGTESPEYIRALHAAFSADTRSAAIPSVIKAFNIATKEDFEATKPYEGIADYFLFDTKGKSVGGNGEKFDWSVLADYVGETPFLLSGGIGPDDAARIKAFHHPRCIGIDLNSRFECSPGVKDIQKLSTFLKNVSR